MEYRIAAEYNTKNTVIPQVSSIKNLLDNKTLHTKLYPLQSVI